MSAAAANDYSLIRQDPTEKPCPSCGRYGCNPGGVHEVLGPICDGCWNLLVQPKISGMMPVAWIDGWPYRCRRPRGLG